MGTEFLGSHEMCRNEVELMLVNVLQATGFYISKWLILCFMNVTPDF